MYEGINASDGVGIGVAQVAIEPDLSFVPTVPEDAEAEKARYADAVKKFVEMTNHQIAVMAASIGDEAAMIMGAHIEFAEDPGIKESVDAAIENGICAEQAVSEAYDMYYNMF
ncbi:MAG: phosphoenolpyruvate--protein phosphotransferase, partial [Atopobiaceae bacterium]|nr:phosphoenolpyruvate--protein phosphotransferase [Atopobiaceae bacterium]